MTRLGSPTCTRCACMPCWLWHATICKSSSRRNPLHILVACMCMQAVRVEHLDADDLLAIVRDGGPLCVPAAIVLASRDGSADATASLQMRPSRYAKSLLYFHYHHLWSSFFVRQSAKSEPACWSDRTSLCATSSVKHPWWHRRIPMMLRKALQA